MWMGNCKQNIPNLQNVETYIPKTGWRMVYIKSSFYYTRFKNTEYFPPLCANLNSSILIT